MLNQYTASIAAGCLFEIKYSPFGRPVGVELKDNEATTHIPIGNDHFSALLDYLETKGIIPSPNITWVSLVRNSEQKLLYYETSIGKFVDVENPISDHIRKLLREDKVEIREPLATEPIISIEANVFLPRNYKVSGPGPSNLKSFYFESTSLGLPVNLGVTLLQAIDTNFFDGAAVAKNQIKHSNGNVLRIFFASRQMRSVYKWANAFLDENETSLLRASQNENIALFKRGSRGPTTSWYFDWMVLHHYIWVPILEISNRVIDLINRQTHRKTTGLLSRDDLGDIVCLRIVRADETSFMASMSSLRDEQINLFPSELNWDYHPLEKSFHRVRFLLDRGLYFESVLVAQAALEGIVNWMFPENTRQLLFDGKEPKWETKFQLLRDFIESGASHEWLTQGAMAMYLNGGLKEIYDLRNHYAHDALEKRPDYIYKGSVMRAVRRLLRPLTETWESSLFIRQVSDLHALIQEFEDFLKIKLNKTI